MDFEILSAIVAPNEGDLPPDAARTLLDLRFRDDAITRLNDLAERNQRDGLAASEAAELDSYLRVGEFLNLVQAKARKSLLRQQNPSD